MGLAAFSGPLFGFSLLLPSYSSDRHHHTLHIFPFDRLSKPPTCMKLVVRVQYVGDRARQLLHDDQAAEYTKGLIDDLEHFGFPMPHEQKPIEKSGFMLCVWHVERESVRSSPPPSNPLCSYTPRVSLSGHASCYSGRFHQRKI